MKKVLVLGVLCFQDSFPRMDLGNMTEEEIRNESTRRNELNDSTPHEDKLEATKLALRKSVILKVEGFDPSLDEIYYLRDAKDRILNNFEDVFVEGSHVTTYVSQLLLQKHIRQMSTFKEVLRMMEEKGITDIYAKASGMYLALVKLLEREKSTIRVHKGA